jgi:hypothetical protein
MRRIVNVLLGTAAVALAFTLAYGTAAESPLIGPQAAPVAPVAVEPSTGVGTPESATEGRTPQRLVIDDVRRMDWRPGILSPATFTETFEVLSDDPRNGYSGTPETLRLLLAHATSGGNPKGPAPGNRWLTLAPGDEVEVPWGEYEVTETWDAPKPAYASQPPVAPSSFGAYVGALVMVTCIPLNDGSGRAASHNHWVVARPAEL